MQNREKFGRKIKRKKSVKVELNPLDQASKPSKFAIQFLRSSEVRISTPASFLHRAIKTIGLSSEIPPGGPLVYLRSLHNL